MTNSTPSLSCYRCNQPPQGICKYCERNFCETHGNIGEKVCRREELIQKSFPWVIIALVLAAVWVFFWRPFWDWTR